MTEAVNEKFIEDATAGLSLFGRRSDGWLCGKMDDFEFTVFEPSDALRQTWKRGARVVELRRKAE